MLQLTTLSDDVVRLFAPKVAEFEDVPLEKRPPITNEHWALLSLITTKRPSEYFPARWQTPAPIEGGSKADLPKPDYDKIYENQVTYLNIIKAGYRRSILRDLIRWDLIRGVELRYPHQPAFDIEYILTNTAKSMYSAHKLAGQYRKWECFLSGLQEEGKHQYYHIWYLTNNGSTLTDESNAHVILECFKELDKEPHEVEIWQQYGASSPVGALDGLAFRVLYDTGWHTPAFLIYHEIHHLLKGGWVSTLDDAHYSNLKAEREWEFQKEIWTYLAHTYEFEPDNLDDLALETQDKLRNAMYEVNPNWDEDADDTGAYPENEMLLAAQKLGFINLEAYHDKARQRDVAFLLAIKIQSRPDVKPEHREMSGMDFAKDTILPLWRKHRDRINHDKDAFERLVLTILHYTIVPFPPQ